MKKGEILLFIGAFIWGNAFVAQSLAMNSIEPWTFNTMRAAVAVVTLLAMMPFFCKKGVKTVDDKGALLKGGLQCGIFLCAASIFQQYGITMTTVGKAAFITAMYVVLVPVFSVFIGTRRGFKAALWAAVALAAGGLYLLSNQTGLNLVKADVLVFLCAVCFAFQIMSVDVYACKVNGIMLSMMQFAVMAIISFFPMMFIEHPDIGAVFKAALPILYTGVLSSGVAYTFQILGQRDTDPALASIIMSFESVFAALSGWLILGQALSLREMAGCALMFAAILLAQKGE